MTSGWCCPTWVLVVLSESGLAGGQLFTAKGWSVRSSYSSAGLTQAHTIPEGLLVNDQLLSWMP